MIDVAYSLIDKVDKSAYRPLAFLIDSFLKNHSIVGSIDVFPDKVVFSKGYIFTVGEIALKPYGFESHSRILYYNGPKIPDHKPSDLEVRLINIFFVLKHGYISKL